MLASLMLYLKMALVNVFLVLLAQQPQVARVFSFTMFLSQTPTHHSQYNSSRPVISSEKVYSQTQRNH